MSDIYLQITETPTVVTLSAPVVSGALSSTVTVANVVTVALDSNSLSALENVTVTVGAAITGTVTVSNFPASQAVTFGQAIVSASNITGLNNSVGTDGGTPAASNFIKIGGHRDGSNSVEHIVHVSAGGSMKVDASDSTVTFGTIRGTVTVGNTVTIAGTVTANPTGTQTIAGTVTISNFPSTQLVEVDGGTIAVQNFPETQPVSLTTLPALVAGTAQIGSVTASISNSVTIASLPLIAGTVSIGNLGDGISTFWADNAVNDISGAVLGGIAQYIDGYDSLPISGTVTVGNSVIIGSLPAISGTVTANLAISSTVITSGSFSSLTSATLVPANPARKMATVYNLGAGKLFVNAGATATTLGGGFMVALSSGDFYECNYTTTTLSAIFATAGTASWVSN